MKLIGKTTTGFICAVSNDELAHLTGHFSTNKDFSIGDSIAIDAMWDRLYRLASVQRELDVAATNLAKAIELTKAVAPVIVGA